MFLLDTNILIYFMKNSFPSLTQRMYDHDPANLLISSITVFELEYGAEKSNWGDKTRRNLYSFLSPFTIIPFTTEDAVVAGRIRGQLERHGNIIGPYDIQIAAQGIARNLTIITHNIKEFSRIPGIKLEDWVE